MLTQGTLYRRRCPTPIGDLTLIADDTQLLALNLPRDVHPARPDGEVIDASNLVIEQVVAWLDDYFAGRQPDPFAIPIMLTGSSFRQQVWRTLMRVPWGHTISYGELAHHIDPAMSAQAIGGAMAYNPICLIVPCHRVVAAHGLGGFGGGSEMKKWLLRHEGIDVGALWH